MSALSDQILSTIRQEISLNDKPENQLNYQRFFKEPLENPIGLKSSVLRKISSSCYKQFKHHSGRDIFDACDQLLASNERYMGTFAFEWTSKISDDFRAEDIGRFESWINDYVNDWA